MPRRRLFLAALVSLPAVPAAAVHPKTRRNRRILASLGIGAACVFLALRT